MNRREAIKAGITATAAILTMTGCKSKEEPLTVKRLCEVRDGMKERYGRSPGAKLMYWDEEKQTAATKQITQQELYKVI